MLLVVFQLLIKLLVPSLNYVRTDDLVCLGDLLGAYCLPGEAEFDGNHCVEEKERYAPVCLAEAAIRYDAEPVVVADEQSFQAVCSVDVHVQHYFAVFHAPVS